MNKNPYAHSHVMGCFCQSETLEEQECEGESRRKPRRDKKDNLGTSRKPAAAMGPNTLSGQRGDFEKCSMEAAEARKQLGRTMTTKFRVQST